MRFAIIRLGLVCHSWFVVEDFTIEEKGLRNSLDNLAYLLFNTVHTLVLLKHKAGYFTFLIPYAESTTPKPDVTPHNRLGCCAICSDTQLDTQYSLHWFTMVDIDGQ
jgi:hypothetical protein